ncbi:MULTISPECIES: DUF4139 domain-containing protein [Dyella]|uniref:DUF4139 domain-containing protein n=1 Tax=Dyella TaxID=231454 RepID=UPI0026C54B67
MSHLSRSILALSCAAVIGSATAAPATGRTELTLYRSDDGALYNVGDGGSVEAGYAMAREPRQIDLKQGVQDIVLGGLPAYLDSEALALNIDNGAGKVLSQRLRIGQGADAALGSLVGQPVDVVGSSGQVIASGTLLRASNGLLVSDAQGQTSLVREYAAVRARGTFNTGSSLELRVEGARAGKATASLSYPTGGLGWRAAYIGTLADGNSCKLQFESRASIANRSGRDWNDTQLTLIAGEPRFARNSGPRPMMMAAAAPRAKAAYDAAPEQDTVGDYRSYTLPGLVTLPDGSVTQTPLYATRSIDCERTLIYEAGNAGWSPNQPLIARDVGGNSGNTITSTLALTAFDSLPAGNLRVMTLDRQGSSQFIGEGRIADTPKRGKVDVTLGNAFDLRGERERTDFKVDKSARTMDEAFRVTLTNAGDSARTVTVREHPFRWREWSLASSSAKPSVQKPDLLEFRVQVPANGKVTLDYTLHYQWAADVQPQ